MLDSFKRLLRLSDDTLVSDQDSKRLARYDFLEEINQYVEGNVLKRVIV